MKKFKSLSILCLCAAIMFASAIMQPAQAQSKFSQTVTNPTGAITNTSTDTMTLSLPGYALITAFQPVITKVSGTVAGNCILQVSIDGVNYFSPTGDTLTLANVAINTTAFTITNSPYTYYRVLVIGSGTMAATAYTAFVRRKTN